MLMFLRVFIFLALYIGGVLLLPSQIREFLEPLGGRVSVRMVIFLWTLALYFLMERKPLSQTIFFQAAQPLKSFLKGASAGGALCLLMIGCTIFSQSIRIESIHWNALFILKSLGILALRMLFIAASEEIALRGYVLNQLKGRLGPHGAVLSTAILFGLLHLPSISYALMACLVGILLGYAVLRHGIYYAIAWHMIWNLSETFFFGSGVVKYQVQNVHLAGDRLSFPDQAGWIVIPILFLAAWGHFRTRQLSKNAC